MFRSDLRGAFIPSHLSLILRRPSPLPYRLAQVNGKFLRGHPTLRG